MKFSFMSFSCPELNLDEMIAAAKKYGYNGIEPRISSNHKHKIEFDSSQSFRSEFKEKSKESGIAFSCIEKEDAQELFDIILQGVRDLGS